MRVGASGEDVETALLQRLRERIGVRADLPLVVAEGLRGGDPEAGRLRGDDVVQRAALHPGEHRAVDCLRMLLAAEHEPRARSGQRLVRGRGDEVAVLDRVRVQVGRDQPGEVGHVAQEQRADLVGDLAEPPRLDRPRIRGAAADDELRAMLLRQRENVVVVDEVRLPRDAVVDDRVQAAREVDLQPVRQMAAVRQLQREDRVARLQDREVDGHVRLRPGMRLDVRVLRSEQGLRAVDRELFDLVDDLAAAVVAAPRIPLGVLVRRHAADGLQHRRPGEVLGRDELDLVALALELALEERRHLRIDLGEPGGPQLVERQRGRRHRPDATPGAGREPPPRGRRLPEARMAPSR